MNLMATLFFSQFMAMMSVSMPMAVLSADEDTLLQELGKLIGGAIRGVRGEEPAPPQQAMAIVDPNGNGLAPSEKDQQECRDRLQAHSAAMQEWLAKTCELTTEQVPKMKELFDAQLAKDIAKFAKTRVHHPQNQAFPATFLLLFTKPSGLATNFSQTITAAVRKELLTEDQSQLLEAALSERATIRGQAFLSYVVSLIDKELYLTTSQRDALASELAARKSAIHHPLYSFSPQSYYLPYESLSQIIPASAGKNFLEPSQKKRLQDLSATDPNGQHIIFRSETGPEEWHKQMNEAGRQQRDKYLRAIAVRVTYFQKELELSEDQIEHLTVAGKGAAVRALGDWKESTEQTIEQMEQQMAQMQGNFAFGSQNMDTAGIEQNEIWSDAMESIIPGVSLDRRDQRAKANRTAMAAALVALLDDELWLTPDQREPLQKLVVESLPAKSDPAQQQEYIREIVLLAYPLFKTSDQERGKLFTEPQGEVWKSMQTFFQWQAANNYVQIPLRNQGGSFGVMLSN